MRVGIQALSEISCWTSDVQSSVLSPSYVYNAAVFDRLCSLFVRRSNGSAIAPWDERRVGDFRLWIESREHLRIVHINRELEEETLAQCSFLVRGSQVTITRLNVAHYARRLGWGTELILELRRRFPDHQIHVSGIEIDPIGIAFWKKLSENGLVVASELADVEKILEKHRQAPAALWWERWRPPVQATDAARMLRAEYDQQSSVAQR